MNQSSRKEYVKYRLEQAFESFDSAVILAESAKWNSSINRMYYSAYYAVSALLVATHRITKTHTGAKTQFFKYFLKTEIIDLEFGKLYSDLFDWRQKADYGDFYDFKAEDVIPLFDKLKQFVESIDKQINITLNE